MSELDITKEVNFKYPGNSNSPDQDEHNEIMDEDSIPEESVLHSPGTDNIDETNFYGTPDDQIITNNSQTEDGTVSDEIPETAVLTQDNQEHGQFDKSPETLINEAEASEKGLPPESKNEGYFFDRQKVFLIVGVISIITIFFLVFLLPMLSKDKVKNEKKMQQASKSWSTVDEWVEPAKDDEPPVDPTPMNSSEQTEEEEEEIPEVVYKNESDDDNISSSKPKRPVTNNNEQQKSFFNVKLDSDYNMNNSSYGNSQYRGQGQPQNSSYPAYAGGSASAYTPAALNENISQYMASLNGDNYDRMNNQSGKQKFFDQGGTGGNYNWNTEYTLWKGTIIPAVLETSINTDLPGVVIATVTTNVYSSLDGKHLLIPQGSKLYAQYSSSISYGQNRVQVIWNTLIRPDGLEINLGGLNGVDAYGASGYAGFTDGHPFEFLKALGLIACFSLIDTKLNNTIANSSNMYTQNILSDTYSEIKKLDNKIIDKALDVQPTIKIPNGSKVNLITNISMEIPPLEPYSVNRKYVRNR